jgi:hypothetical protein
LDDDEILILGAQVLVDGKAEARLRHIAAGKSSARKCERSSLPLPLVVAEYDQRTASRTVV